MKTLVIATHNKNKYQEIKALLEPYGILCKSLTDIGYVEEILEDEETFLGNAMKKAKTIAFATGLVTLGDDSGLIVDSLPELLGVKSKRFSKEGTSLSNNQLLLDMLKNERNRAARFISQLVLYYPNDTYYTYLGKVEGEIAFDFVGNNGFGYDPIFIVKETGKRMAELSQDEKNRISHRGRALAQLIEDIKNETVVI